MGWNALSTHRSRLRQSHDEVHTVTPTVPRRNSTLTPTVNLDCCTSELDTFFGSHLDCDESWIGESDGDDYTKELIITF